MRTVSPSEIAAARIPKITDLRDQLCYGDAKLSRCSAFSDDIRVFRRKYSFGRFHGADLWDWKSSEHQAALKLMTASFLDDHGYGEVYWPSDPTSPNFNSLQYSKDSIFIAQTMRQLIFRLNLQQYRNNKYKKKEHQPDPKVHEIIELDSEESPTKPNFPTVNAEIPSNSSTIIASTENYAGIPSTKTFKEFTGTHVLYSDFDVYDVPTSPGHESEKLGGTKRKLKVAGKKEPTKRSKVISLKVPPNKAPVPDPKQSAPKTKWTSPRGRKTVQRPDYASVDVLDQAIASQTMTDESTPGYDDRSIHQTNAGDVLNYIRTNRPSVTCESVPPTPTIGQQKSVHDSHIDPNLERIIPSSSVPQPKPGCSSSNSSIIEIQPKALPSPASTTATFQPVRETTQQTSASPIPSLVSQGAQTSPNSRPNPFPSESSTSTGASSTPSKPNIDFTYIVILSRTPVYQYKTWTPRGHFMEKSLSELIAELPFDNEKGIIGLIIRLQGPGVEAEETLNCDEEAKFDATKGRFLRMVKMCLKNQAKTNPGKMFVMNFEIEALREGGIEEDDDDDDDFVF